MLFHRRFLDKRIAVTSLRRLYLRHRIRRKKVRQEKYLPEHVKLQYNFKRRECIANLETARFENRKMIYLDEVNFTKRSVQSIDWSTCKDNQHVDQR